MSVKVLVSCLISVLVLTQNISAAPTGKENLVQESDASTDHSLQLLEENGHFEGDIVVSEELIREYYNLPTDEDGAPQDANSKITKRGATPHQYRLWPNAIVPYTFAPGIGNSQRDVILAAMEHWEDLTCLRFVPRSTQTDYVEYKNDEDGCFAQLGRRGGKQFINVETTCRFGRVVHEIGHAVGFWHEQSRPDRDSYIDINYSNIQEGRADNFNTRTVNSLGWEYDYGSVMHYSETTFVRSDCPGCKTIEVSNSAAYQAQGSPTLGQRNALSAGDVHQANDLYSCPKTGVTGVLTFLIKNGVSLPQTVTNPYVRITAVDTTGKDHVQMTAAQNTISPNWNEELQFSPTNKWQHFTIEILDKALDNDGADTIISTSKKIALSGKRSNFQHCIDSNCSGYVSFDYTITVKAALTVTVKHANLGSSYSNQDPYVKVEASSADGSYVMQTPHYDNTFDPVWNLVLNFGCQNWINSLKIQIWDRDTNSADDPLSDQQQTALSPGNHTSQRYNARDNGYLIYDYNLNVDEEECSSNLTK